MGFSAGPYCRLTFEYDIDASKVKFLVDSDCLFDGAALSDAMQKCKLAWCDKEPELWRLVKVDEFVGLMVIDDGKDE